MSWDLAVDSPAGSLGPAADVRRKIDASIPGVDWSDESCGVVQQGGYSLELALMGSEEDEEQEEPDPDGPVEALMISVRGSGQPLPVIVKLCKANGWTLADAGAGEEIDLDNPSDAGWREFQKFRDGVVGSVSGASKPGFFARLFGRKG
jgi:hypothetical protein